MKRLALGLVLLTAFGCADVEEPPAVEAVPPKVEDPPAMAGTGHQVEWGTPGVPCEMKAGSKQPVSVTVKNVGDQYWYAASSTATGRGAIRLSARWWSPRDSKVPVIEYDRRADLKTNLGPQQTATLTVEVTAPATPGSYRLQFDLVEEMVVWFENKGAARLMVPVVVK